MSEKIDIAIGKIESNLKKLESAREQVLKVVESNNEYSEVTHELVNGVNELAKTITKDVTDAIKNLKNSIKSNDAEIKNIGKKCEDAFGKKSDAFQEKLNEQLKDFKTDTNSLIKIATKNVTEQKEKIDESIKSMNAVIEATGNLISKLDNIDFNKFFETINQKIDVFETNQETRISEIKDQLLKKQNINSFVTWAILIIGFVIVGLLAAQ